MLYLCFETFYPFLLGHFFDPHKSSLVKVRYTSIQKSDVERFFLDKITVVLGRENGDCLPHKKWIVVVGCESTLLLQKSEL